MRRLRGPHLYAVLALLAASSAPAARAAGWVLPATPLAASANGPSGAVVAVDPAGDAIAAWTDDDGAGMQSLVVRTRPAGGPWGAPETLASDRGVDAPAVTMDAAGDATVAWIESADGSTFDAHAARRGALDGSWSVPADFGPSDGTAVVDPQTQVRADAAGDAIAAWLEHDTVTGVESVRGAVFSGGTWSAPSTLSNPGDASAAYDRPQIAPDASGGALVAWTAQRNADPTDFPLQTSTLGGGGWTGPTDAIAGTGSERSPLRLVGVDGGDVAATWFEGSPATALLGALRDGGTWTVDQLSDDVAPGCVPLQALGADTGGGATVVWKAASTSGLEARHVTSGGWDAQRTAFASATESVSDAALDHGTAAFVASDDGTGDDSLLASERQPDGSWSAPALLAAAPSGTTLSGPDVATDGAGDALAGWTATDALGAKSVAAAAFQAAGPQLTAVSVPGGVAGVPVGVSASARSTFASVAQIAWDFGDGSALVVGAAAAHTYAQRGTYTVTVTATDSLGNVTQATRRVTVTQQPPPPPPSAGGGSGGGSTGGARRLAALVRPRVGGLHAGVLVLAHGSRTLTLLVRNLDRVRLSGGVALVRPRRGRIRQLTLASIRTAGFAAGHRTTLKLRLSDAALRALRAASGFRLPVVLTLRLRAADGRRVTVTLRATLDASARFGVGVRAPARAHAAC